MSKRNESLFYEAELSVFPDDIRQSTQDILPVVYQEMRLLARQQMHFEFEDSLDPTGLVHEAYLKLQKDHLGWPNKRMFLAAASIAMRRILIDRARFRKRQKRGGSHKKISISKIILIPELHQAVIGAAQTDSTTKVIDLLDLEAALTKLAEKDRPKCTVVSLRFLMGCDVKETADVLGISTAKVKKDWAFAKAWLRRELSQEKSLPKDEAE